MQLSDVRDWFAERIPVRGEELRELTNEPVPHHLKHWWFALGGTPEPGRDYLRPWRDAVDASPSFIDRARWGMPKG